MSATPAQSAPSRLGDAMKKAMSSSTNHGVANPIEIWAGKSRSNLVNEGTDYTHNQAGRLVGCAERCTLCNDGIELAGVSRVGQHFKYVANCRLKWYDKVEHKGTSKRGVTVDENEVQRLST